MFHVKIRQNLCVLIKLQACLQISFLESWNRCFAHLSNSGVSVFRDVYSVSLLLCMTNMELFHFHAATESCMMWLSIALADIWKIFELQKVQCRLSILVGCTIPEKCHSNIVCQVFHLEKLLNIFFHNQCLCWIDILNVTMWPIMRSKI